jgi:hypothetical protein
MERYAAERLAADGEVGSRPGGTRRDFYLELIEPCVRTIAPRINDAGAMAPWPNDLTTPRFLSSAAVLLSVGRALDLAPTWKRAMDYTCAQIERTAAEGRPVTGMDFIVRELMLALFAIEGLVDPGDLRRWRAQLSAFDPERVYASHGRHNITIYNLCSEYLRQRAGLTDAAAYSRPRWVTNLEAFNDLGMYRDPGCPMLYDLTVRFQISLMLHYGYRGEFCERLNELLRRGGMVTLFSTSANFELPYGGRSNQYPFNEALIAGVSEFEARRHAARGNLGLAGAFKRTAHAAARSAYRWLVEQRPPRHVKNLFPIESGHGVDSYGLYERYLPTAAAFFAGAYLMADDNIGEAPAPAELGGYVLDLRADFHKVLASAGGYSIELDTRADHAYDATGFGRIHRAGAPSEIALSMPFTRMPAYRIADGLATEFAAIGPAWQSAAGPSCLAALSDDIEGVGLQVTQESAERIAFELTYRLRRDAGPGPIVEHYELSETGLAYWCFAPRALGLRLVVPLLATDGAVRALHQSNRNGITVTHRGWSYTVASRDAKAEVGAQEIANRNGAYRLARFAARGAHISAQFRIARCGGA